MIWHESSVRCLLNSATHAVREMARRKYLKDETYRTLEARRRALRQLDLDAAELFSKFRQALDEAEHNIAAELDARDIGK